jgi:Thioesterase superfamily
LSATVQLDVHFIDAVAVGEFVEAKCRVARRTRSLIFMSSELVVGDRVVATAKGVWKSLAESGMQSASRSAAQNQCEARSAIAFCEFESPQPRHAVGPRREEVKFDMRRSAFTLGDCLHWTLSI